jgi:hypothetical protein
MRSPSRTLFWSTATVLVLVLAGSVAALSGWFPERERKDVQVWAVFSCNKIASVIFVDNKHKAEEIVPGQISYEQLMARVEKIPKERRYYINVKKHCPATIRRI